MSVNTIGPYWHGFSAIQHLVVFGDSYSDVGYDVVKSKHPTPERPLGVEFPGFGYMEPGTPNWVGHLITNYATQPLLVYDFAVSGDDISGLRKQVQVRFLPHIGEKPEWARWESSDTLFITWIGINDCASGAEEFMVKMFIAQLLKEQEDLYNAGARNFLFIDVPPISRTPIGQAISRLEFLQDDRVHRAWNSTLYEEVIGFARAHPDVTALFFSSWNSFTRILDDPRSHGFEEDDLVRKGGNIWVDQLHPTTKMHDWIARDLSEFLQSQPAHGIQEEESGPIEASS